jgi:pimeloyl-ACP methyl ester carboxylesterase
MLETLTVTAADGRRLCVEVAPAAGPDAILVHPGTPNSRHLFSGWVADAQARSATIAAYDRPGYGGSTPHPGRTVADGAQDARAVADALGFERFAVWGVSGGGPYALACAALLGDRVRAAAVLGSSAPWGADGLDYFAGMGQENVDDMRLLIEDRDAAWAKVQADRLEVLELAAQGMNRMVETFSTLVSGPDRALLEGPCGEFIAMCTCEGLAPGAAGWFDDGVAEMEPWGFDLSAIRIPVKVWHGAHDQFVPRSHGEWLAAHIPGAQAEFSDTEGHLAVPAERIDEVHAWLLANP